MVEDNEKKNIHSWLVTYRGNNGGLSVIRIISSDRAGVFRQLETKHISAIKVEPDINAPQNTLGGKWSSGRVARKPLPIIKGLAAALIAICGALIVWRFLLQDSKEPSINKHSSNLIAEAKHSSATITGTHGEHPDNTPQTSAYSSPQNQQDETRHRENGEHTTDTANIAEPPPLQPAPVLSNSTDQLIAMATSIPVDVPIPPLPAMSDNDTDRFIKTLSAPIEISDNDSEDVRKIKESIQNVRLEIADALRANPDASLSQILNEHRELANRNTECRAQIIAEINELVDKGDIESAQRLRDTMNIALQQMGAPEVTLPITEQERAEQGFDEESEEKQL